MKTNEKKIFFQNHGFAIFFPEKMKKNGKKIFFQKKMA
jgi:hypothetical protein